MPPSGTVAAAEHDAQRTMLSSHMIAVSNFLKLGLSQFAKELSGSEQEFAVGMALVKAGTQPKPHEDPCTLGIDEGNHVANLWNDITRTPNKEAKDANDVLNGRTFANRIARR